MAKEESPHHIEVRCRTPCEQKDRSLPWPGQRGYDGTGFGQKNHTMCRAFSNAWEPKCVFSKGVGVGECQREKRGEC